MKRKITQLVLATSNPGKRKTYERMLKTLPIKLLSLEDVGVTEQAEETGMTIEENARLKAIYAWSYCQEACLAEDTKLNIDALSGLPDIYPARWAGEGASSEDTMLYTLERLKDVPVGHRTATFTAAVSLILRSAKEEKFTGHMTGSFLTAPKPGVKMLPGMPYSTIFVPTHSGGKVIAEMSEEAFDRISHRGKACSQVLEYLQSRV